MFPLLPVSVWVPGVSCVFGSLYLPFSLSVPSTVFWCPLGCFLGYLSSDDHSRRRPRPFRRLVCLRVTLVERLSGLMSTSYPGETAETSTPQDLKE